MFALRAAPIFRSVIGHPLKALVPTWMTELGIVRSTREVQESNAESPMKERVRGRSTEVREVLENALFPMDLRFEGREIALIDEQERKAAFPIEVMELGRTRMVFPRDEHRAKAASPMDKIVSGISIFSSFVQSANWF